MTKKTEENIRDIWDEATDEHPCLIILDDEGQLYSSQTNGVMCDHPVARGYLFSFEQLGIVHDPDVFGELHEHICMGGPVTDEVRALLKKLGPFEFAEDYTSEAWMRVQVNHGPFKNREAILVHGNCD